MASLDVAKRIAHHGGINTEVRHRAKKRNMSLENSITNYDLLQLSPLFKEEIGYSKGYEGGKLIVSLADFDFTDTHAHFLINVVHKNNATTVIRDTSDRSRNEVKPKNKNQGYETSCHLVIDFNRTRAGYLPFYYDVVPKLTIGKIESFFNALLLQVSNSNLDMYTVDKNGRVATDSTTGADKNKFKTRFNMTLTSDEELLNKVKDSTLSKIHLISYQTQLFNNVDRGEVIIPKKYIMEIESSPASSDNLAWIRKIAKTDLGRNFDQIKFNYPTETGPRTAVMDLNDVAISGFESALTKKSLLEGFRSSLKDSYDDLQSDIIDKLVSLGG
ncbi:hypothetical protein B9J80_04520 [Vibrio sp. V12_P9A6T4]|uniref:hypothetical protein n=1 Tax=Vibrio sp. V12_P9A6T4 TaxID=1938667 RepID=UPI000B8E7F40|nr:hypothetical protein [Vibrio sp. V12_P9A6T4]OXX56170.1 hypothetical protein B9J80_04520 [Vibrio sp. V12_P9A6T4]